MAENTQVVEPCNLPIAGGEAWYSLYRGSAGKWRKNKTGGRSRRFFKRIR
jgi:hypothetical protein